MRAESVETFFKHYFGETEYNDFLKAIDQYTKDAREITGYKSIKFFSKMNLATPKAIEEKTLTDWQYKTYEYQIIDRQDPRVSDFLYFSPNLFPASELDKMVENYVQNGLYKAMVGSEEFAESFRTSEWLYYSLKDLKHFDYTAVISGYLKSVEQLLYKIVMLNVDNNCKIVMSGARDVGREAVRNRVRTYKWDYGSWTIVPANDRTVKFKYIDLTQAQVQYMDSSIGTFEYFLKNNPYRFDKVQERARLKQSVSRLIAILFPELEKLVPSLHMVSVYALPSEAPGASQIASMHLTHLSKLLKTSSRGHYGK